jgi:hypothetical protein
MINGRLIPLRTRGFFDSDLPQILGIANIVVCVGKTAAYGAKLHVGFNSIF